MLMSDCWKCWSPGRAAAMRIAQVAPLYEAVPPRLYGGTERIVAHLTDALVELGHDVTLFASADAQTAGHAGAGARSGHPARSRRPRSPTSPRTCRCCTRCVAARHEFDILHFHVDLLHFPLFERLRRAHRDHAARPARPEGPGRGLSALAAVPAGLDLRRPAQAAAVRQLARRPSTTACRRALYAFTAEPRGGYLAFLGRISPEKRPGPRDRDRHGARACR